MLVEGPEITIRPVGTRRVVETDETRDETAPVVRLAVVADESRPPAESTAEQRMWAYYVTERPKGCMPTGAELDRIAGTNNYGRRVLRRWKNSGRVTDDNPASGASTGPVASAVGQALRQSI